MPARLTENVSSLLPPILQALTSFCRENWLPNQIETVVVDLVRDEQLGLGEHIKERWLDHPLSSTLFRDYRRRLRHRKGKRGSFVIFGYSAALLAYPPPLPTALDSPSVDPRDLCASCSLVRSLNFQASCSLGLVSWHFCPVVLPPSDMTGSSSPFTYDTVNICP